MNRKTLDDAYDDDEFDFGFTSMKSMSELELKHKEKSLTNIVDEQAKKIVDIEQTYKEKLSKMYRMIVPLLNNLEDKDGKEYIYWPNRNDKIAAFRKKLDALMK